MYFRLYRTGYKKTHYGHFPVVLTHSTPDKQMLARLNIFTWLNVTIKLNVNINFSTTEHAFSESCVRCLYVLLGM